MTLIVSRTTVLWGRCIEPRANLLKPRQFTKKPSPPIRVLHRPMSRWANTFSPWENCTKQSLRLRAACDLNSHAISPWIFLARIYLARGKTYGCRNALHQIENDCPRRARSLPGTGHLLLLHGTTRESSHRIPSPLKIPPQRQLQRKPILSRAYSISIELRMPNRSISEILTGPPQRPARSRLAGSNSVGA